MQQQLVLIVEDDRQTAEQMEQGIRSLGFDVWRIPTESDFYSNLDQIAARKPVAIVIDVMLRWADPSDDIPRKPSDYEETGGYRRAGMRCSKRIREDARFSGIPVLIFTVLAEEALGNTGDMEYLQKGNGYVRLLEWIKQATRPTAP